QVSPVNQFLKIGRVEVKFSSANVRDEFSTGMEFGIIKLLATAVSAKMRGVGLGEEGALVMVEPPGQAVTRGIFKVDDGILVAIRICAAYCCHDYPLVRNVLNCLPRI